MDINNLDIIFTQDQKNDIIKKSVVINNVAMNYLDKKNYIKAIELFYQLANCVDPTQYLLLNSVGPIKKQIYLDALFNLGTLLKMQFEEYIKIKVTTLQQNKANRIDNTNTDLTPFEQKLFDKSLHSFVTILQLDFENENATIQITSIYSNLIFVNQTNLNNAIKYLNQSLFYDPTNSALHYNLGHVYNRLNNLQQAIIHYKLSLGLLRHEKDENEANDKKKLTLNNYNGLASVYRSIKNWPESFHYLSKAYNIDHFDPDINNQLGVTLTELRETDLAEKHYQLAIENYQKTFISTDAKFLLSEIYLNFGHLKSYQGDNFKSIECYNKSLQNVPKFILPFQNKIMNLNYIVDQIDDPMYLTNQHKQINKLYDKNPHPYIFDSDYFKVSNKINIGIVSPDLVDHPVSYFICTFLKNFNHTKFNITCYSEALINTDVFNTNLHFKIIKNKSQKEAADIIYNDHIHILLDLSAVTALNRLDVFAFKPAPIQITYLGYPFTTGLNEMTYRFTDSICDGDLRVSQQFYTEKLISLKNCFTCYDPLIQLPDITEIPRIKNPHELVIACFHRVNKITDTVIITYNKILQACPFVKIMFKTKALISIKTQKQFIEKFDKNVQNRLIITPCTIDHLSHVKSFNLADISIDTFPYSGTTISCESLLMGCPILSLYDSTFYRHAQNVTCSLLKNSDLDFYICNNIQEMIDKIIILHNKPVDFWKQNKQITRDKFLNGFVCNKKLYMDNLQNTFVDLFNKHRV